MESNRLSSEKGKAAAERPHSIMGEAADGGVISLEGWGGVRTRRRRGVRLRRGIVVRLRGGEA